MMSNPARIHFKHPLTQLNSARQLNTLLNLCMSSNAMLSTFPGVAEAHAADSLLMTGEFMRVRRHYTDQMIQHPLQATVL